MTIESSVRNKVIELHKNGKKRHEIVYDLNISGIHVSTGSVSNIISEWRQRESERLEVPKNVLEQSDLNKPDVRVTTFPKETLTEMGFKDSKDLSIKDHAIVNTRNFEENGYPVAPAKGAPLNWFTNGYETKLEWAVNNISEVINASEEEVEKSIDEKLEGGNNSKYTPPTTTNVGSHSLIARPGVWNEPIATNSSPTKGSKDSDTELVESNPPRKIYPREPKYIEDRFELERKTWDYYGAAQTRILNQIKQEKDRRRHDLFLIETRRKRLEQMQSDLTTRESRILESEPYLSLAKKLQETKLTLEDALPWLETISEVAQMYNMDSKQAAISVAEDIRLNKQLGDIRVQIQRANQELALINMATMQKQQALTVVEDLVKKGVTSEQIAGLIDFASQWYRNQQLQQPGGNGNNGHGSISLSDSIRMLKSNTADILNKLNL
jgi:hypothetical protein